MAIILTLPWPKNSSVNHIYARTRGGGVRLTDEARAWRDECWYIVKHCPYSLPTGDLRVTLTQYLPDRRRHDIDNPIKSTLDAVFVHGFNVDDDRVTELIVKKMPPGSAARLEVLIESAGETQ